MKIRFLKTALPVATFLLLGLITLGLWDHEIRNERNLVRQYTETIADQIKIRIEGMMNTRMSSLQILAERWVERVPPDFSKKRFIGLADKFYSYYPGFLLINWIDSEGILQWIVPDKGSPGFKGINISEHGDSRYQDTFEKTRQGLEYAVTPCVDLFQGGLGFEVFLPLVHDGRIQGYLNGVFQIQSVVDICISEEILNNFNVKLYEEGHLIFRNAEEEELNLEKEMCHSFREIEFPDKTWLLDLGPGKSFHLSLSAWDNLILLFGFIVSCILSFLLYILFGRMEMYMEARDHSLEEIRKRKQAESVLKKNEDRLEGLLAELDMKNKELETFVYSVSHDLKTPIVTIEGFAGALREDFGKELPKEGKKYLDYISDATLKMDLLINDLLTLARIGVVAENRRTFSFANLVSDVLISLQHQIGEREIEVNVQDNLPSIFADRKQIAQVMDNLLSNAIKYIGNDNPSPHIDIGLEKQDGKHVFFVRDNGIGIDEKYTDKIFQVFQRLPFAKDTAAGTGIGLTIVKRIIENHEGRIWVDSECGKGSTFYFTLKQRVLER